MADKPKVLGPLPGGQTRFLQSSASEILFGGQAGPGKTEALILNTLGMQFESTKLGHFAVQEPGYMCITFRRESNELGKLLSVAHKYYPYFGGKYHESKRGIPGPCFIFPGGAMSIFAHLHLRDSHLSHQSFEYQLVQFDELTQFLLQQYLFMFLRRRSSIPNLWVRTASATNPVGPGLVWVRERFIDSLEPYQVKTFIADPEHSERNPRPRGLEVAADHPDGVTRQFIPGFLSENPFVQRDYVAGIKLMGKTYEKAMLGGGKEAWSAFSGNFFSMFSADKMGIDPFMIPPHWNLVGSIDPGWSSPCSFSLRAVDPEGVVIRLFTYYEQEKSASVHAAAIKQRIVNFPWTRGRMPSKIVAGSDAFHKKWKQAPVASDATFAKEFLDAGLVLTEATTDRVNGWWVMKNLMEDGRWYYFRGTNDKFVNEVMAAVSDENNPEDIQGGGNDPDVSDHAIDEERYGNVACYRPGQPKVNREDWRTRFLRGETSEPPRGRRREQARGGWEPGAG